MFLTLNLYWHCTWMKPFACNYCKKGTFKLVYYLGFSSNVSLKDHVGSTERNVMYLQYSLWILLCCFSWTLWFWIEMLLNPALWYHVSYSALHVAIFIRSSFLNGLPTEWLSPFQLQHNATGCLRSTVPWCNGLKLGFLYERNVSLNGIASSQHSPLYQIQPPFT